MKSIIKVSIAVIGLITILSACQKQSNFSNSGPDLKKENSGTLSQNQAVPITYDYVIEGLNNMGAVLVSAGNITSYVNFTGYNRIERYYVSSTNTFYNVFVWDTNEDDGMDYGTLSCTKSWHSGGENEDSGCYGEGSQCDVELRNGEYVVICCDDIVV